MMQKPLILMHEESLRITHPVFDAAPKGSRVVYVWDDAYVKRTGYSLKRLIFIYETLCGLDVEIIGGDMPRIVHEINPSSVYIPYTNNPLLLEMIDSVREMVPVEMIEDSPFISFKKTMEAKRFFQYWSKAEKTAFLHDGGLND